MTACARTGACRRPGGGSVTTGALTATTQAGDAVRMLGSRCAWFIHLARRMRVATACGDCSVCTTGWRCHYVGLEKQRVELT